jgi:PD-(D/E)XK nuclease superfamily protein
MAREPMTASDPFSASRIVTWMNCNRKAAWQYIAGYEDPGNEDTKLGTEVHAELETAKSVPGYLPNRLTEAGAIASEGLPYVSDFTVENGAKPEGAFTFRGRHLWRGFIDLRKPGYLVDYKTTGDFRWAKTEEELLLDPQAVLYAVYEFLRCPELDVVELMWLYLKKRAPYSAKPVRIRMTREHALRAFAALESYADEMLATAVAAPGDPALRHRYVLTLQPNADHCDAYRGCPHRNRCNLSFFQAPTQKGKGTVNLLDRLKEMDAANGAPAAPVRSEMAPMVGVPSPLSLDPAAGRPALAFAPDGAFAGIGPTTVTMTPAVSSTTVPSLAPSLDGITFDPTWAAAPDAPATEPSIPAAIPTAPATAFAPEPGQINPPAKRGRGRPKKNSEATAPAAPAAPAATAATPTLVGTPALPPTVAAAGAELAASLAAPAPVAPAPTGHRVSCLYVGCLPHRGQVNSVDFDSIVAKAKVAIGPAAYYAAYGYKANGMLLQMVEAIVQSDKPGAIVVPYPASPEATLCLSHLRSVSETVVEAVR